MVRIRIHKIFKNNYLVEKPWSERPLSGPRDKLIKKIRKLLNILSGNEVTKLLIDIIKPNELKEIAGKYYRVLKNLSIPINKVKLKNKHVFFHQFKLENDFTLNDLKELGYKISKSLWSSCKRTHERLIGGRPPISDVKKMEITEIMEKNSSISSYRTALAIKRKYFPKVSSFEITRKTIKLNDKNNSEKLYENVRFRTIDLKEAKEVLDKKYEHLDKDEFKNKTVSLSSFRKYVLQSKKFKKPYNWTDLCNYCETGRILKNEIINFTKKNTDFNQEFSLEAYSLFFSETNHVEIKKKLEYLNEIYYHKEIAERQRNIYHKYRTDPTFLGSNSILIEVDWKEKIYYGKISPRQVQAEYYKYGSCSLLGFGIYYVDQKINLITNKLESFMNHINIDLLKDDTEQKAFDLIIGFRYLRTLNIFKNIEKKNYIIFSDTAKSFRCEEICNFYFIELASHDIRVSLNYFCEYHGKSMLDQHFSVISQYLKKIQNLMRLTNVQQICDALNKYQENSNKRKIKNDILPIKYLCVVVISPLKENQIKMYNTKTLNIFQIESLYNLQNVRVLVDKSKNKKTKKKYEYILHTSIFSDLNELISIQGTSDDYNIEKKGVKPVRLEPFYINIEHLKKKRQNIQQDLRLIERHIKKKKNPNLDLNAVDEVEEDNIEDEENHHNNNNNNDENNNNNDDDEQDNNNAEVENHDLNNEEEPNLTQNNITPNINDIPLFCLNRINANTTSDVNKHLINCNRHCNFISSEEIQRTDGERIKNELENHRHPKCLVKVKEKYNKPRVYYTIAERKIELINHYKVHHNIN